MKFMPFFLNACALCCVSVKSTVFMVLVNRYKIGCAFLQQKIAMYIRNVKKREVGLKKKWKEASQVFSTAFPKMSIPWGSMGSSNLWSWKGPTGTLKSNSCLYTVHFNNPILCLRVLFQCPWSPGSLQTMPIPWGAWALLGEEPFPDIPPNPLQHSSSHSLGSSHYVL